MKKRHFIDSFASLGMTLFLLLASSCGKGGVDVPFGPDDDWTPLTGDSRIRFAPPVTDPVTKTTSTLPSGTSFAVFAFYQPGTIGGAHGAWGDGSGWTPNFMYNQKVDFDGSDCTYSPLKYWPNNEENTITFWAYYPHNAAGLTLRESAGGSAYGTASTGLPYLDYTTVTGNALVDLMSSVFDASVKDLSKPSLDTPVNLVFRHLLSRIVFHFVKVDDDTDNYEVRLTEVTIRNIFRKAGHPGDPSGSWSGHTDNGNLSVYADTTPLTTTDNPVVDKDGTLDDMAVMPIPQILTDTGALNTGATIYISYEVVPTGGGDPVTNDGEFVITDLHSWVAPAGWEQNYLYTYTVRITPGDRPIVFSASIVPWDETEPWVYHYVD